MLNENKDERFSPNARIRKVWISKRYLVHKDELIAKGKLSTARGKENNERYPYHSKQEIKKEKPSKEKHVSPKERHTFSEGKGLNTSRRKIPPRFVVHLPISPRQKWYVVQHIRSLYVRLHINGKPMSKVLVDNGSIVNVMPLRMLRALGRGVGDLIETKVSVLAFIGEISKTLGLLPIDITMGSKTSLSSFFMINSIAKYNALLCFVRKRLDSYQLVCSVLHSPIFTILER